MKKGTSIKNVELFKYFKPKDIDFITHKLKKIEVPKGSIIFKEKDKGKEMFIIRKGKVEVSLCRDDAVLVLAELGENSFFGEMALLTEKERSATISALTDCKLYSLSRQDFLKLFKEQPAITAKILLGLAEVLCERVLLTNQNLETYFLVNKAIVDNEQFRNLYIYSQKKVSP